jgi:hypothetical protein
VIRYIGVLLVFAAVPAQAQTGPDSAISHQDSRPYVAAAVGGSVGVGIGWLAGGVIGGRTAECDYPDAGSEMCGLGEFAIGAIAGGTVGAAAGSYVAARLAGARPHPLIPLLGSVVGLGTGFLVGAALDRGLGVPAGPVYLGAAIGQGAFAGLLTARFSQQHVSR